MIDAPMLFTEIEKAPALLSRVGFEFYKRAGSLEVPTGADPGDGLDLSLEYECDLILPVIGKGGFSGIVSEPLPMPPYESIALVSGEDLPARIVAKFMRRFVNSTVPVDYFYNTPFAEPCTIFHVSAFLVTGNSHVARVSEVTREKITYSKSGPNNDWQNMLVMAIEFDFPVGGE